MKLEVLTSLKSDTSWGTEQSVGVYEARVGIVCGGVRKNWVALRMLNSQMGCSLEGCECLNPNQVELTERDRLKEISVHNSQILQIVTL